MIDREMEKRAQRITPDEHGSSDRGRLLHRGHGDRERVRRPFDRFVEPLARIEHPEARRDPNLDRPLGRGWCGDIRAHLIPFASSSSDFSRLDLRAAFTPRR